MPIPKMWYSKGVTQKGPGYEPLIQERDSSEQSDIEKSSFEASSPSISSNSSYNRPTRSDSKQRWCSPFITFLNIMLFATSLSLFVALPYRTEPRINSALRPWNWYSPVLDEIDIPIHNYQIDGKLFPSPNPADDKFGRREPSPETDAIWEDYEIQRSFVLSREQVLALGKDPEMTAKYPDEDFGFGNEAYMAGMDAFHVLHCFNAIRQEAFKDYYWDGERYHMEGYSPDIPPKRRHSEMQWVHLRHCVDIVTQNLMCHADTSMVTMTWLEEQDRPWPDFSVNKKCVDFDKLVQWRDENALDVAKAGSVKKPEIIKGTDKEVKIADEYWQLFGNDTVKGDKFHHPLWDVDEKGMPVH